MNSPAFPARASLLRSRARADSLYRLLSQAARSLMAREKQMPLSASLVFLSCSRFSPSITSPRWRALSPASAGCSFSNGTRKTNAAFSVACFSFVLALLSFDHEPALARPTAFFRSLLVLSWHPQNQFRFQLRLFFFPSPSIPQAA